MSRPSHTPIAIGMIAAGITTLVLGFTPARADFFSLDGRFQCLDRKEAVCGDAQQIIPSVRALAPAVVQPQPESGLEPMPRPLALALPQQPVTQRAAEPTAPVDPLRAIAKRVQAGDPSSSDIAWLRQAARAQNSRAVELLAWCELHGIGTPSDPIEAYLLYGVAASNGIRHARENQTLVYEQALNSEQRQQLLNLTSNGLGTGDIALAR